MSKKSYNKVSQQPKRRDAAVKERLSAQKIVFATVAVLLAATIIASALIFFIPLINDSREKNFNYLTSDLSYYMEMKSEDYKGISVNVDIARPKDGEIDSTILYYLASKRSSNPLYDGAYQKDVVIDAGDKIAFWYRAYIKKGGKEIEYGNNFSKISADELTVGMGGFFAQGIDLALVKAGITPSDTPSFKKITEGTVAAGDVAYVTYTRLEAGADESNAKSYKSVRVDLGGTAPEEFGEGFVTAITGAEVGGAEQAFQSTVDGKTYNYTKVKVDFVTRCEGDPYTLEGYFPYDFSTSVLRNETVYLEIYIDGVVSYETPEFDDEFITELLSEKDALITLEKLGEYPGDNLAEKYRAFAEEYLLEAYEENLDTLFEKALWKHYTEKVNIKNYPTKKVNEIYQEYYDELYEAFDKSGGVITDRITGQSVTCQSLDEFAPIYLNINYTGENWRTTLYTMSENLVRERLILYYIMRVEGFVPTEAELAAKLAEVKNEYLDEYMLQYLESIGKDKSDYTEDEYAELVEERREVLFDYFDEDYFEENAYYDIALEKFKSFATAVTLDERSNYPE